MFVDIKCLLILNVHKHSCYDEGEWGTSKNINGPPQVWHSLVCGRVNEPVAMAIHKHDCHSHCLVGGFGVPVWVSAQSFLPKLQGVLPTVCETCPPTYPHTSSLAPKPIVLAETQGGEFVFLIPRPHWAHLQGASRKRKAPLSNTCSHCCSSSGADSCSCE